MTDEQNARLNAARAESGDLFNVGDTLGLHRLAAGLYRDAAGALVARQTEYRNALMAEAELVSDSAEFLEAEWRMTNGEAVARG